MIATDAHGLVTLMNPVAEGLTGWAEAEAVGQPLEDVFNIINEQTGEGAENPVARVLREGVVVGLANHTLLIAKDGTRRPIADSGAPMKDEAGNIIGTVMVFRDITERKRAEETLKRRVDELSALNAMAAIVNESLDVNEILSRAVDEALPQIGVETASLFLLDREAGEVALVAHQGISNEFARAGSRFRLGEGMTGRVAQTGQPIVMPNLEDLPEAWRSHAEKEGIKSVAVVPLMGSTGVIGTMSLSVASKEYLDTAGVGLLLGLGRQIGIGVEKAQLYDEIRARAAELETAFEELRDAQEELVRKGKLAILGQLAGGVGHELRNPLGAIKNAVYFLNMVGQTGFGTEEPDPEVKETLEILDKEVRTSERIISSLLDFARPKPPVRRKVDVNDVVRDALSRTTVPGNVEVVTQLGGALPTILADPDQLVQVFGNLILNGAQAMPEGGQLTVKTWQVSEEKPARSGQVAVSITDTGVGISEEHLGRVFEPLFTTKAKGIGLGLAVTRTLVEGHGGSIEVQSGVGKGSTFSVWLPTSRAEEK